MNNPGGMVYTDARHPIPNDALESMISMIDDGTISWNIVPINHPIIDHSIIDTESFSVNAETP